MTTVELHRVLEGAEEYACVATLEVAADGTYRLDDPEDLFPLQLHVLVADEDTGLRQVRFEDDPHIWALNLGGLLRTGYLVPVVTSTEPTPAS